MKISISANCTKYNPNQIREHLLCQSTEKLEIISTHPPSLPRSISCGRLKRVAETILRGNTIVLSMKPRPPGYQGYQTKPQDAITTFRYRYT